MSQLRLTDFPSVFSRDTCDYSHSNLIPRGSAAASSGFPSWNRGIFAALGPRLHSPNSGVMIPQERIGTYLFLPAENHHRFNSVFFFFFFGKTSSCMELRRSLTVKQQITASCRAQLQPLSLCFPNDESFCTCRFPFAVAIISGFLLGGSRH